MPQMCWSLVVALLVVSRAPLSAGKKPDVDELGRSCRAGKKRSCNRLVEIAKSTSDSKLGTAAVENLSDQILLTEIAQHTRRGASAAREAAIKKLTDQSVLLSIARGDRSNGARRAAIAALTDQGALAGIAKEDNDAGVRKAAVAKLADQDLLAEIALHSRDSGVRQAAVSKVTGHSVLAEVARHDQDSKVRAAAITKVTDPSVLAGVARHDQDSEVRAAAVTKVTDPSVLADIAGNDADQTVRKAAIGKVTDQSVLIEVAKSPKANPDVRASAIDRLTDQAALAEIAINDDDANLRKSAVMRLTDQATLARIARSDKNKYVHWAAVKRLADQALVTEIGEGWRATHPQTISFTAHASLSQSYESGMSMNRSVATANPGFQFAVVYFTMSNNFDSAQSVESRQIHLVDPSGQQLDAVLVGVAGSLALEGRATWVTGSLGSREGSQLTASYSGTLGRSDGNIEWTIAPLADYRSSLVFVIPAGVLSIRCEFIRLADR